MTSAAGLDRDRVLAQVRQRVVGYAASRVGAAVAEDVAQETLLLLTTDPRYAHLEDPADLVPVAIRVTWFKLRELWRQRRKTSERVIDGIDEIDAPDTRPNAEVATLEWERAAEQRALLLRVKAAIERLPDRCRAIFAHLLAERSLVEIRTRMEAATMNTVYTWVHRCRKNLLQEIGGSWQESTG